MSALIVMNSINVFFSKTRKLAVIVIFDTSLPDVKIVSFVSRLKIKNTIFLTSLIQKKRTKNMQKYLKKTSKINEKK